jgi:hypothetical protein
MKAKTLKKILRFRLPDDIVEVLQKMKRKSEFVRCAIHEKMEREGLLKEEKAPF